MKKTNLFIILITASFIALTSCVPITMQEPEPEPFIVDSTPKVTGNASTLTRITSFQDRDAAYPQISPDNQNLLLTTISQNTSNRTEYAVVLIDTAKPDQTRPLAGPGARFASWFPDNQTITYVNLSTNQPQLVKTQVSGGGVTFIGNNPFGSSDNTPDVSPDGTKIAFSTTFGGPTIAIVNADGTELTTYVAGSNPDWSQDGSKLLFTRETGTGTIDVFTLEIETGALIQLTTGTSRNFTPSWGPNDQQIVFSSNRAEDTFHIYTMNADGSNIVQLTQGNSSNGSPTWSDDNFIYFSSNAGSSRAGISNIWRITPAAGE